MNRFWDKVNKSAPNGCWEWIGAKLPYGYGVIGISGKNVYVHRYSWELHYGGKIPADKCVCHHCDNPRCVRPDHLFVGSQADNMKDMISKGRDRKAIGIAAGKTKLTPEKILEIRMWLFLKYSIRTIASRYGVGKSAIQDISSGKTWSHV